MSTKFLQGSWVVDVAAPAIPYSTIPFDSVQNTEVKRKQLYDLYGFEIKPMYYTPGEYTIYGGTPYLTLQFPSGNQEKCLICKIRHDGDAEGDYTYTYFSWIDIEYNRITILPNYYNAISVDWFETYATAASISITYKDQTLINLKGGQKVTLHTAGKRMETDLVVETDLVTEKPHLQEKTVTVSGDMVVEPDGEYHGLSRVYIEADFPEGGGGGGSGGGGADTSDATAEAEHVLKGYTAYGADGKFTGRIETYTGSITSGGSLGGNTGGSQQPIRLQEKVITKNGEVLPDSGYDGLSRVMVQVPNYGGSGIVLPTITARITVADLSGFTKVEIGQMNATVHLSKITKSISLEEE